MKKLLFLILLITFLFGCKEKKQDHVFIRIPDTLKKDCFFNKNTYWIYRNDTSSITDCTYVNANPIYGSNPDYQGAIIYQDYIKIPLQSSIFQYYLLRGKLNDRTSNSPFFAGIFDYTNCCPEKTAFLIIEDTISDFKEIQYCDCGNGTGSGDVYKIISRFDNYTLNNNLFKKVIFGRTTFQTFNNGKKDTIDFYYSPGKGIVKCIFRVDTSSTIQKKRMTESWSILRYSIKK